MEKSEAPKQIDNQPAMMISKKPDAIAPDGSEVRFLAKTMRGSMAQFTLPVGKTSIAVAHRTVEEVWFFTQGTGQFWMKSTGAETILEVHAGVSLSIEVGTHFQFRNAGNEPLVAIGTTMPPWPGSDEAYAVAGKWAVKNIET
jgi:mannose-6-phosphate isomerase-like protein (cupin superfamily)